MTASIRHKFNCAIPDDTDPAQIRPSNWNDEHDLIGLVQTVNGSAPDEAGNVNVVGTAGPAGPQGVQGPAGADGAQGAKGDTGAQGIQGDVGPQGIQGIPGVSTGGAAAITQVEVDFGATPATDKEFIINDAAVTAMSRIMATVAYEDTGNNTADEILACGVVCAAGKAATGSFTLAVASIGQALSGTYKINYLVGCRMQIRDGAGNLLGIAGNPLKIAEDENETFIGTYTLEGVIAAMSATAHTLNTGGFFWGINPAVSGKVIRIERVGIQINMTTALAAGFPTSPRLVISRMAFTGSPSGAAVPASGAASTINKMDTNYPANVLDIRSAITGLTCTYGACIFSSMAPSQGVVGTVTASQVNSIPSDNEFEPRETEYECVIRPGEGFVIWQPEAGSTGETRKATFRLMWEEVTIP